MQIVRESIFVSAVRAFFSALLAMVGVIIGFAVLLALAFSFSPPIASYDDDVAMQIMPGCNQDSTALLAETAPVILHLDIEGIIGDANLNGDIVEKFLRVSRKFFSKGERVKGILLNINSPGGSAIDSDIIYRALLRYKDMYKVPIFTYTPGMCASGGYLIACASDKIYASPVSIVGSVGVLLGPNFNFYDFMQQHGIQATTLTNGKNKIKFPMFSKLPEGADATASYQDIMDISATYYNIFVNIVDTARSSAGLTSDVLINKVGAQIYIGDKALKLGYVDSSTSSYNETLEALCAAAGIDPQGCQVVRLYHKRSALQELVSSKIDVMMAETKEALFGVKLSGKWNNKFLYYYNP